MFENETVKIYFLLMKGKRCSIYRKYCVRVFFFFFCTVAAKTKADRTVNVMVPLLLKSGSLGHNVTLGLWSHSSFNLFIR